MNTVKVPVLDKNRTPLMPTTPGRAAQLLKSGRAVKRWFRGIFCIQLMDREGGDTQPIAVGVDPGSKKEAYTVKSESHTYLNIQCDAVSYVKKKLGLRKQARNDRRQRKTPYRKNRNNHKRKSPGWIPPSTRARWGLKLRILNYLKRIYPITHIVVEDIAAVKKKGAKKWNGSFSPLETGKNWFYERVRELGVALSTVRGYETARLRSEHGLKKSSRKLSETFDAHCVDSWVMANSVVGGHTKPDSQRMFFIRPFQWMRRQLHYFQFRKGGIRPRRGSTRSLGFTRGSIVRHPKWGLAVVGGTSKGRISLSNLRNYSQNITHLAAPSDLQFICHLPWIGKD